MRLPEEFLKRMKGLLGKEYQVFLSCYKSPALQGIRLNPLKSDAAELKKALPFEIFPAPFSPYSYYGPGEKVGHLPAHHGGVFYAQEPSAASAVTMLGPMPGEKILDLCAAPGGKSGQIAGLLRGKGLLWSNEVVRSRVGALLSNLERLGVRNSVVSSCHPDKLCKGLAGFFDRVLVDAPCSGEGMFRRDPGAVAEWTPESPAACALRQQAILDSAALAVREGGVLVYSTCTFSLEENEETVLAFLKRHPEFEACPVEESFGRPALLGVSGLRVYPMDGGEGHFVAKLFRRGKNPCRVREEHSFLSGKQEQPAKELYSGLFAGMLSEKVWEVGEKLFVFPGALPELRGLGVLRAGVELAEKRGNRLEPAHGIFMSRRRAECRSVCALSWNSPELAAFLRGEELPFSGQGYTAVCVGDVVLGFGKASEGRLKNRYPKGLRNRK